jgi:hypothetical protein
MSFLKSKEGLSSDNNPNIYVNGKPHRYVRFYRDWSKCEFLMERTHQELLESDIIPKIRSFYVRDESKWWVVSNFGDHRICEDVMGIENYFSFTVFGKSTEMDLNDIRDMKLGMIEITD